MQPTEVGAEKKSLRRSRILEIMIAFEAAFRILFNTKIQEHFAFCVVSVVVTSNLHNHGVNRADARVSMLQSQSQLFHSSRRRRRFSMVPISCSDSKKSCRLR